jgi:hypothetical protein
MAKRSFNVLKSHVLLIITLVVLICLSELSEGSVSSVARIATGVVMIYVAIGYALWLLKSPTAKIPEENL